MTLTNHPTIYFKNLFGLRKNQNNVGKVFTSTMWTQTYRLHGERSVGLSWGLLYQYWSNASKVFARNVFVQIVLQFVIRHQIICQIDRKGGILFFNINPRVLKFCMGKDKHFWKYKQQCIVRLVKTTVHY